MAVLRADALRLSGPRPACSMLSVLSRQSSWSPVDSTATAPWWRQAAAMAAATAGG